jgi:hypothetical protein
MLLVLTFSYFRISCQSKHLSFCHSFFPLLQFKTAPSSQFLNTCIHVLPLSLYPLSPFIPFSSYLHAYHVVITLNYVAIAIYLVSQRLQEMIQVLTRILAEIPLLP